jgi:hypothetical protein
MMVFQIFIGFFHFPVHFHFHGFLEKPGSGAGTQKKGIQVVLPNHAPGYAIVLCSRGLTSE